MRLLKFNEIGELRLTNDLIDDIPPYTILSHTWGAADDEVTFDDVKNETGKSKAGYTKILFCGMQAAKDNIEYFWLDTCCIDKANHAELSEAIRSVFRWFRNAIKCYVYLSDVQACHNKNERNPREWESAFRRSRWFTRGWTLQELLAPASVEFFSREGQLLGSKKTLEGLVQEITQIPIDALRGAPLSSFSVDERLRWAARRETRRVEDRAYCLLGIFDIFIPLMYGEGDYAFKRLKEEIDKLPGSSQSIGSMASTQSGATPIFLSFSKPIFPAQQEFIRNLSEGLRSFRMEPQTLGVTVYDTGVPLTAIKHLMSHSAGLISVAFRRTHIEAGERFDESDGGAGAKEQIRDRWLTSPWPHIEAGMAFQIDLPILILRESGVMADGILEKGSSAFYLPTFDLDISAQSYLSSDEWQHIFHKWSRQVMEHLRTRKIPFIHKEPPHPWPRVQGILNQVESATVL